MRLAGFLIVLHVTPHLTIAHSPWSCPTGQVIKPCLTRRNSNLSEGLQNKQEQVLDTCLTSSTWHPFAVYVRAYLLKATELCQGSPFCYQGHCTWLIQSADCQRVSWNCRVNWLTRHLSFSSSQASLQSLGLSLQSQPDSPSSAKLTNSSVQYFFLVEGS